MAAGGSRREYKERGFIIYELRVLLRTKEGSCELLRHYSPLVVADIIIY